jgi:hypothetical protein
LFVCFCDLGSARCDWLDDFYEVVLVFCALFFLLFKFREPSFDGLYGWRRYQCHVLPAKVGRACGFAEEERVLHLHDRME